MFIHTIDFGFYKKINVNMSNLKIWNNDEIKKLLDEKYPKLSNYYDKVLFIKSREDIAKLVILKEHGGLYINIYL